MSIHGPGGTTLPRGSVLLVLLVFLAVVGGAFGALIEASPFDRFLGPLHPALAVGIAALLALAASPILIYRHGLRILGPGAVCRGALLAAGFAVLFAIGAIAADLGLRYPETINVPVPFALLVYPVMALIVELLFHVSLLGLLLHLFGPIIARTSEQRIMTVAIVLVALAEPILQVVLAGTVSWTEAYTAISVFLFGVVQLILFRRYGLLTMLGMRLFYYLLWHIGWGHLRLDLLF